MNTLQEAFREMERLHHDINHAFRRAGVGRNEVPNARNSFLPGRSALSYPLVNVGEDDNAFFVDALAPGVDPNDLSIQMKGSELTISGEKKNSNGEDTSKVFHRAERATGRFVRTIDLGVEVNSDDVNAEYVNGVIRVRVAKAEAAKPRQIEVRVG